MTNDNPEQVAEAPDVETIAEELEDEGQLSATSDEEERISPFTDEEIQWLEDNELAVYYFRVVPYLTRLLDSMREGFKIYREEKQDEVKKIKGARNVQDRIRVTKERSLIEGEIAGVEFVRKQLLAHGNF